MKKYFIFLALSLFSIITLKSQNDNQHQFTLGIQSGYNLGLGFQANITAHNILMDNPLNIRFTFGHTNLNPGSSDDARRIFINNATNGTPEKKGRIIDYRLDFLVPINIADDSFLKVGPRYANFKGNFNYIGGNENFDIVSNQFGFGVGIGKTYAINDVLNLEVNAGFDYFLPNTITGHDTSYSPDDENINGRNDNQNGDIPFTFADADEAINQPKYMPQLMIGINYKL